MKPSTLTSLVLAALVFVANVAAQPLTDAKKAMAAQDFAKAVEILEADWDNVKGDIAGLAALTEAALKAGMFDRCMTYSARLVDLDKKNPVGYRCGAQAFYWRAEEAKEASNPSPGKIKGLYEESKSLNRDYLKLKAKDVEMWSLLGHTLYWLEQHDESAVAFKECTTLDPKNAGHLKFLARAHRFDNKFDDAAAVMDKAIALDPENAVPMKEKADILWFKADAAKDSAGYKVAGEAYGAALKAKKLDDATAGSCAQVLWSIYGNSKDYAGGIAQLNGWAQAHPKNPAPLWWLGYFHRASGDEAAALKAYEKCWSVSGGRWGSGAVGVAQSHWRMAYPFANGQPDTSKSPDLAKLEEAVKWFCKAQGVTGWNWNGAANEPIRSCLAIFIACATSGNLDAGAKWLEEHALKAAPNEWRVLNNLGLYYRDTGGGRRDKAMCMKSLKYYVKAAELVLKDPEATPQEKAGVINDTGVLYQFPQYFTNDMETGIKYYERALTYDPGHADSNENMGLCMSTLGKYEEAIPYFKKVLESEPNRRMSLRGLRRAEAELKDK